MAGNEKIIVKGARVNNLKRVDVEIPRDKLVVITGLSGSGKSSLAFDTLYAEGQRRYVESLSSYARQFMGRLGKPECDYIKGIPPAIAIEQRVNSRNPRSTVGTSTEIYDYIRLLYARIGKTISPVSGVVVKKHTVTDITREMRTYPEGTRFTISAPIPPLRKATLESERLEMYRKQGYVRLFVEDEVYRIAEVIEDKELQMKEAKELLIDRLSVSADEALLSRLADSAETAFFEGRGVCLVRFYIEGGAVVKREYSKRFEADGMTFEVPTDMMFNFNNPIGACPTCEGFGKVMGIDENLVIPDKSRSVYDGAVFCWRGQTMGEWQKEFIEKSGKYGFPIHRPYFELTREEKDLLWHGAKDLWGIDAFFKFVEQNRYKIQYRVMMARYRGKTICPVCHGQRLKPEALFVKVGGKNIAELVSLSVLDAKAFFGGLVLDETDAAIAKRLLMEINSRLQFLLDVGLGYLTLDRLSSTLSGGESQRISLATALGSTLVGSMYILDEPSIGLHTRDTDLLINVLRHLRDLGNTVVVVEHDEEIIRAADYIIDIGPEAGRLGGEVIYQGPVNTLPLSTDSHTVRFLTGEDRLELPEFRRPWNNYIEVVGARKNNLKGIDVRFPLDVLTVVTGVSGSGKSSLVRDVFCEGLKYYMDGVECYAVDCSGFRGDMRSIRSVEYVDQNSIGKSSRSNPVTYLGAFKEIRQLFAEQALAKQMGYTPAYFSFNTEGGRCEECKGEGVITVEMQFMADITLVCESCHGKRFNKDVLEVEYRGVSIYDVLEMTVDQAIEFFGKGNKGVERKIVKCLQPLRDVGLGYIKLGQSSSTLSGGENQRVKLAYYLSLEKDEPTLFIFDEPTTGLHFHDIKTLLKAFNALIDKGHTIVLIEHNLDVIKCADHVIDLGPEGGEAGGYLVCAGTPEQVAACPRSHTGRYLRAKL